MTSDKFKLDEAIKKIIDMIEAENMEMSTHKHNVNYFQAHLLARNQLEVALEIIKCIQKDIVSEPKGLIDNVILESTIRILRKNQILNYTAPQVADLLSTIKQDLKDEIKKKAHWMYPEYSNGQHDAISLTAHELIGDMDK